MITKKDIITSINEYFKRPENVFLRINTNLRREAIDVSSRVYERLKDYFVKYPTEIKTFRTERRRGITISLRIEDIGFISIIIYTCYREVFCVRFEKDVNEQTEDYKRIMEICDEHSFFYD